MPIFEDVCNLQYVGAGFQDSNESSLGAVLDSAWSRLKKINALHYVRYCICSLLGMSTFRFFPLSKKLRFVSFLFEIPKKRF